MKSQSDARKRGASKRTRTGAAVAADRHLFRSGFSLDFHSTFAAAPSGSIGFSDASPDGCTGFYRVSELFTGFFLAIRGFFRLLKGRYRILLDFTGFYWVLLGFTGFYWIEPSFSWFHWVLIGFTGCY